MEDRSYRLLGALATRPNPMIIPFSNLTAIGGRADRIEELRHASKLGGQKPLRGGSCRFDPVSAARYTRICVKRE